MFILRQYYYKLFKAQSQYRHEYKWYNQKMSQSVVRTKNTFCDSPIAYYFLKCYTTKIVNQLFEDNLTLFEENTERFLIFLLRVHVFQIHAKIPVVP